MKAGRNLIAQTAKAARNADIRMRMLREHMLEAFENPRGKTAATIEGIA